MSRSSVLLRMLIALLLVLNGIGGATASVRMLVEHEALAPGPSAAMHDGTASPCHEGMAGMGRHEAQPSSPAGHGDAPDCCGGDHCACECIQHCCAMPAPALAGAAPGPASTAVHRLSDGRPEPVRPRLIRPPIG